MVKRNPNRSMLFWWMGNTEDGGEYYQVFIVENNQVAVQMDRSINEPFRWPLEETVGLKRQLEHDGWRVVEDKEQKHFAALGDPHRTWTCRNLAWLVDKLIPENGAIATIGSGKS